MNIPTSDAELGSHPAAGWDLGRIVWQLREVRERWRDIQQRQRDCGPREFPSRDALREIVKGLSGALFPMRLGPRDLTKESEDFFVGRALDTALNGLLHQLRLELTAHLGQQDDERAAREARATEIVRAFARGLPGLRMLLDKDVQAAFDGDPAAHSVDEVLLCYPGVLAIIHHRLAHALHQLGAPLVARIVAEIAHSETGIDIHPGAEIGASFFIDHGTGVVIGETAVIGDRVRLYQAVTLGARRFASTEDGGLAKGGARHPIIEDDVVIYAGATVLGRITIGRGSSIGGNVWLTRSVPPGSHVTQASLQHEPVRGGGDFI